MAHNIKTTLKVDLSSRVAMGISVRCIIDNLPFLRCSRCILTFLLLLSPMYLWLLAIISARGKFFIWVGACHDVMETAVYTPGRLSICASFTTTSRYILMYQFGEFLHHYPLCQSSMPQLVLHQGSCQITLYKTLSVKQWAASIVIHYTWVR